MNILLAAVASGMMAAETDGLFRTRTIEVEAEFATAAEAASAKLKLEEMPRGKKYAFATRWDDSNPRHTNTLAAITAARCKGTFYFVSTTDSLRDKVMKPILAEGSRIGSHTCTHPFLTQCSTTKIFREIAANRPELEAVSGSCVSSFTLPFGALETPADPELNGRIGEALKRTGIYAGCETSPEQQKKFGLSADEWVAARRFSADDRGPDPKLFAEGLAAAKSDISKNPSGGPCIVLGTHSWHPDEGYPVLTSLLKPFAADPSVWRCTVDEYAAFRMQMRRGKVVSSKTSGNKAIFKVTVPETYDLGSAVPLTVSFGAKPKSVRISGEAASVENGIAELQPGGQDLPQAYSLFRNRENKQDFAATAIGKTNGRTAGIFYDEKANAVKVRIANGPAVLRSVNVALRLPLEFKQGVVFGRLNDFKPKETREISIPLEAPVAVASGKQYFALQIDGIGESERRIRIWAETEIVKPEAAVACPRDKAKVAGPFAKKPDAATIAKLSVPGAELPGKSAVEWEAWREQLSTPEAAEHAVSLKWKDGKVQRDFEKAAREKSAQHWLAIAYDFEEEADCGKKLVFKTSCVSPKDTETYLNGKKLVAGVRRLAAKKGTNRVVLLYPVGSPYSYLVEMAVLPESGTAGK